MSAAPDMRIPEEDALRADLYDFLGAMLSNPPSKELLAAAAGLTGDDTELGRAIAGLARVAAVTTEASAGREFGKLFVGVGRGELLPYASYYLTGFLNEKPLASLRRDMRGLGVEREAGVFEPEDGIASLMETMAGLIRGRFGAPASLEAQKGFWAVHVGPWAGHFFTDLEGATSSVLYASVGAAGRIFMDIEREGFRLAPQDTEKGATS